MSLSIGIPIDDLERTTRTVAVTAASDSDSNLSCGVEAEVDYVRIYQPIIKSSLLPLAEETILWECGAVRNDVMLDLLKGMIYVFFWFGLMMTDDLYIYSITSQLSMCIYDRHSSSFFFSFFYMGRSALTQAGHGRKQMQTNEEEEKEKRTYSNTILLNIYLFGIPNGQNDFFFFVLQYTVCA